MFVSAEQCENIKQVQDQNPCAAHIEPVEGGWMIFDTTGDYEVWLRQE